MWFLPGPLSKFWPNAHTDKLRAAATAWHNTAQAVETVTWNAQAALDHLESNDDTTQAIGGFWSKICNPGDNTTVLAAAYQICQSLGDACGKYADAIDNKRSDVKGKMIGAGFAVGVTSIVGVLGTLVTGGGSDAAAGEADVAEVAAIVGDVAADTAAAVESEVGAALGTDLVATVEAAAENAPAVETAEAETTAVESEIEGSLDEAMANAKGDPNLADAAEEVEENTADDALYQRYVERKAARGKTPLSRDAWQNRVDTLRTNKLTGDAYRDQVAEDLGITPGEGGWQTEYTDSGLGRRFDIANPTDRIGIEVKSGSTPTSEALTQLGKDEQAVREGWSITWQLKTELNPTLMARLQELADKYPGSFTYTVAGR